MALTVTQLAKYVQTPGDVDTTFLQGCIDEAGELVGHHTRTVTVPPTVLDRALLEVAADLYYRRQTRNGVTQFDSEDFTPVRINRDPMTAAYAILRPYVGAGIA